MFDLPYGLEAWEAYNEDFSPLCISGGPDESLALNLYHAHGQIVGVVGTAGVDVMFAYGLVPADYDSRED